MINTVETGHKVDKEKQNPMKNFWLCVRHVGICDLSVYLQCDCVYVCSYMLSVCVFVIYLDPPSLYGAVCMCEICASVLYLCMVSMCMVSVWCLCSVCIYLDSVCSSGVCMFGVCMCVRSLCMCIWENFWIIAKILKMCLLNSRRASESNVRFEQNKCW